MRSFIVFLVLASSQIWLLADPISPSPTASPTATESPGAPATPSATPTLALDETIRVSVGKDAAGTAEEYFTSTIPRIFLRWQTQSLPEKTKLRCVWIAEDVGDAAPKDYHVEETSLVPSEPAGAFIVSRPTDGWPPGKYRVELYAGERLAATAAFTIEDRGD
ncbi:MAG: hypothetical protein M3R59_08795 [Verrucomicrobiota bacterium]|nr:hypothetical protein [Verrucomicrobiota bacterium]